MPHEYLINLPELALNQEIDRIGRRHGLRGAVEFRFLLLKEAVSDLVALFNEPSDFPALVRVQLLDTMPSEVTVRSAPLGLEALAYLAITVPDNACTTFLGLCPHELVIEPATTQCNPVVARMRPITHAMHLETIPSRRDTIGGLTQAHRDCPLESSPVDSGRIPALSDAGSLRGAGRSSGVASALIETDPPWAGETGALGTSGGWLQA